MPRCSATTAIGRRCKNSCLVSKDVCVVHNYYIEPTVDMGHVVGLTTEDNFTIDEPLYSQEKICGHTCNLHTQKCCGCMDLRPMEHAYDQYIDQVGTLKVGKREDGYCSKCKITFRTESWITTRSTTMRRALTETHLTTPLCTAALTFLQTMKGEISVIFKENDIILSTLLERLSALPCGSPPSTSASGST